MGRILRITLLEDAVHGIDLGFPTTGKLLIRNAGSQDVRIGYDPSDVGAAGVNYYTLEAGIAYTFDMGPTVGFVAQGQQMYFNSPDGDCVVEIWFANNR
jgi:hypothetical protein